jgi:hypothetical protein
VLVASLAGACSDPCLAGPQFIAVVSSSTPAALLLLRALTAHVFLCCRRKRSLFLDFLQDFGFGFPSGASQQGECITAAVLWFLVHHGDLGCYRILESGSTLA